MTSNAADWAAVLGLILGGCCSNVFSLEVLIRQAPASGHLITLAQFTLVALEGLYSHLHWIRWKSRRSLWDHICPLRLKPRSVPLYHWLAMVSLFWGVSVLNNYALAFDIPMPFHIVFRSAGLVMSLVMSWAVFGKRYSWSQIGAVLTVSIGILLATLASSNSGNTSILPVLDSAKWVTGIGILVLALFLSAVMGQYQQYLYSTFGRDWREGLFYTHFLALPAFALMSSSISQEYIRYSEAPRIYPFESLLSHSLTSDLPWIQPLSNLSISYLWFYLLLNVLTQCARFLLLGVKQSFMRAFYRWMHCWSAKAELHVQRGYAQLGALLSLYPIRDT